MLNGGDDSGIVHSFLMHPLMPMWLGPGVEAAEAASLAGSDL